MSDKNSIRFQNSHVNFEDLGLFMDSKLNFHNHVNYIFSHYFIKSLGLVCSITFIISSLECLYIFYFILVRSKLEYAFVV
jgi:hypothetical protein